MHFGPENAGVLWLATFAFALLFFVFLIVLQWKIFDKAGHPGALALINLAVFVPFIGWLVVVALWGWFAFSKWPALEKTQTPTSA